MYIVFDCVMCMFAALYIVVSMIMAGMCLAMTILVLHLHHMSPMRQVPRPLQRLIGHGLASLMCMRKLELQQSTNEVKPLDEKVRPWVI